MVKDATAIATECLLHPNRRSVWSPEFGRYVCVDSKEDTAVKAADEYHSQVQASSAHPPLNPQFKLVFLTAAIGTLLFVLLCFGMTMAAGKTPPPLFEKVVMGFFDLAKIGFGAVVGLLGGKMLQVGGDHNGERRS
jgi:hypothetical protein